MYSILTIVTIVCISYAKGGTINETIYPIGGVFSDVSQASSEEAFVNIVSLGGNRTYFGRSLHPKTVDSYSVALELCSFTSEENGDSRGIFALIDARPTNGICDTVCLLANKYNITQLSVGWEPIDTIEQNLFTVSYHPPPDITSKAYSALIKMLQWDKFTILYEDESSFIRLQDVTNSWSNAQEPIIFRKLVPDGDNRDTFKQLFNVEQRTYHILDCAVNNTYEYFNQILTVNNKTEFQSFILTNFDAYQLDLRQIEKLMANVSTFILTTSIEDRWRDLNMKSDPYNIIQLESALTADAINHMDKVILSLRDEKLETSQDPPALCYQEDETMYEQNAWELGDIVRRKLLNITHQGYTGHIEFDEFGRRTNFDLFFMKLDVNSDFAFAGKWNSNLNKITDDQTVSDRSKASISDSKLLIGTKNTKPYFQRKVTENGTVLERGYAKDLIDLIFQTIKEKKGKIFQYEFVEMDTVGSPKPGSKLWGGMIGDLMDHKLSLAICDLTITSERNSVVDFSSPFMSLGIGLLMKERPPEPPKMFSFVEPLSLDVWLYLATTYIIVSFVLLICARMSQEDWVNPHPCNQNPENHENIWSLYNCMWLTMGSIMCQGCDILPRAAGSRWISGMWWFFALIVTASYTANMSTFISSTRRDTDLQGAEQLADQNKISYGLQNNGSTYQFFASSNDSLYQKLFQTMKSARPSVFTAKNEEGLERVLKSNGKYAFFMESSSIDYFTNRNCKLKKVGSNLDSKEYGIAMPKNFPYKEYIDFAILSLQEAGELEALKKKWWEIEDNEENCADDKKKVEDDSGLQMENTSGIFLVLGVGGVLGLIVAVIDFLLHARQISVQERVTFREAVISEWRASLDPRALHKAVAPPRSAAPSTASASPHRERSQSRAVSVLRAATSFINFDEIY